MGQEEEIEDVRFDEIEIVANYRGSQLKIKAFDLDEQKEVEIKVSFLAMVQSIFPDDLGWATVAYPYEGFDNDCGPFSDYHYLSLSPLEFIAEMIEARDTRYRMPVDMKKCYWRKMEKAAAALLTKAAEHKG